MSNFWLKVKIWTKTTLFAIVFLYALIFIYNNSGEEVSFWWWFGKYGEHGKLTFGFTCFMAGVVLTILVRTTLTTMRQVRDLQSRARNQKMERDVQDMKEKAARMQTRGGPSGPTSRIPGAFEAADPPADDKTV
jgi:uncharacterized membrane protein